MATITVSIQQGNNTLNSHRLATENTEALRIQAQKNVNYLLTDESTGFAPENLTATRHGKDLHIAFEGSQEADLIIENYYEDGNNNLLIGLHENGQYYAYIPESANNLDIVTQLAEQVSAGQALGGEALSAAVFNSAFNPAWLFLPLAIGGIAAAAGGGSSSNNGGGSNNNNNSVIASPDIEPSTNNAENKFDGGASVIPSANAGTLNISYLDHNGKKIEIKATKSDHDNDPSTPAIWTATDQNGKTLPNAQDPNSPWIDPTSGKVTLPPNSVPNGETVSAEQSIDGKNSSPATEKITDQIPPNALHISVDQDSGKVSIDPNTDPSTTQTSITYINDQGEETTVITAKGDHDNNPNTPDTWAVVDENGEEISNSDVEIDSRTGTITIAGEKIKAESKIEAKASDGLNISQPATAYEPAAPQPRITANIDGSATVDALKNVKDSTLEISGTYAQPQAGIDTFKFTLNWDGIKWAAQNTSDPITVGTDPADGKPIVTVNAGVAKDGSQITAIQKVPGLGQGKHEVTMRDQIPEPQVIDNSDGSVSITPKTSKIAEPTEVTITYTDESGAEKTVTVSKDPNNNKWTSSNPNITANPITGAVTLPESSVQDGSTVSAKQKVTLTDPNTQKQTSVVSSDETVIAGNAIPNPEIIANNDGSVSIKPSDTAKQTTINYTDENGKEQEKTFTKEDTNGDGRPDTWKDNDPNDKVSIDPMTGEITIPADEVKDGSTATATQTLPNDTQGTGQTTAKAQNGDSSTTVKPDIKAGPDGSAIVTLHPDAEKSTITYTDEKGKGKIVTVSKDPKTNEWTSSDPAAVSIDASGEKPVITVAGTDIKDGSTVTATQSTAAGASDPASVKVADNTPEPTIKAEENGSVSVTPSKEATEVNIRYTDESGKEKTVTVSKDPNNNKWTGDNPSVSVDKDTGTVSIPADKVKDGSEVTANQTVDGQKSNDATDRAKETATQADTTPPVKAPSAPTGVTIGDGDDTITANEIDQDGKVTVTVELPDDAKAGNTLVVNGEETTLTDKHIEAGKVDVKVPVSKDGQGKEFTATATIKDGNNTSGPASDTATQADTTPPVKAPSAPTGVTIGDGDDTITANEIDQDGKVTVTVELPDDAKAGNTLVVNGEETTLTDKHIEAGKVDVKVPVSKDGQGKEFTATATIKDGNNTSGPASDTATQADTTPPVKAPSAPTGVTIGDGDDTITANEIDQDGKVTVTVELPDDAKAGNTLVVNGEETTLTDKHIEAGKVDVKVPVSKDGQGKEFTATATIKDGNNTSGPASDTATQADTTPPVKAPSAPTGVTIGDGDDTITANEIDQDGKVTVTVELPDDAKAGNTLVVNGEETTLTDKHIEAGKVDVKVPVSKDGQGKEFTATATIKDGNNTSGPASDTATQADTTPPVKAPSAPTGVTIGDGDDTITANEIDQDGKVTVTVELPDDAKAGNTLVVNGEETTLTDKHIEAGKVDVKVPVSKDGQGKEFTATATIKDGNNTSGPASDTATQADTTPPVKAPSAPTGVTIGDGDDTITANEIDQDGKVTVTVELPDDAKAGNTLVVNGEETTLTDKHIEAGKVDVKVPVSKDGQGKEFTATATIKDGNNTSGPASDTATQADTTPPVKAPSAPTGVTIGDGDDTITANEIDQDGKVTVTVELPDDAKAGNTLVVNGEETTLTDKHIEAGKVDVKVPVSKDGQGKEFTATATIKDGNNTSGPASDTATQADTTPPVKAPSAPTGVTIGDGDDTITANEIDQDGKVTVTVELPDDAKAGNTLVVNGEETTLTDKHIEAGKVDVKVPVSKDGQGKEFTATATIKDGNNTSGPASDTATQADTTPPVKAPSAPTGVTIGDGDDTITANEIDQDGKVTVTVELPDDAKAGNTLVVNGEETTLTDKHIEAGKVDVKVPVSKDGQGKEFTATATIKDGNNTSGPASDTATQADTTPPVKAPSAPTGVTIGDGDDTITANEIDQDGKVTVTVELPDDAKAGNTLVVNGEETTLTDKHIEAGKVDVKVPVSKDGQGKEFTATATIKDGNNTSGPASDTATQADTTPPVKAPSAPTGVTIGDGDDTITANEIDQDGKVTVTVELPDDAKAGNTLVVNGEETTLTDKHIEAGKVDVKVPVSKDGQGKEFTATATIKDGNNTSGPASDTATQADTTPPVKAPSAPTGVTIGDGDDTITANEIDQDGKVTVTVELPDDAKAGNTLVVNGEETTLTDKHIEAGKVDVKVPVSKDGQGKEFTATATIKDGNNTSGPASDTATQADTTPPVKAPSAPTGVTIGDGDDTITANEIDQDGKVTVTVELPDDAKAGNTLVVNGEETTLTDKHIEAGKVDVKVPVSKDGQGKEFTATATIKDGNNTSGPASDTATQADTTPPVKAPSAPTGVTIGDGDDTITANEIDQDGKVTVTVELPDDAKAGNTLVVNGEETTLTDKHIEAGKVDVKVPVSKDGQGKEFTATATIKDGNNTSGPASDTATQADTTPPVKAPSAPTGVTIGDGDDTITANEIDQDGKVTVTVELPDDAKAGNTLVVNGEETTLTDKHIEAGKVDVKVPVSKDGQGKEFTATATIKDGNNTSGPASDTATQADTTPPVKAPSAPTGVTIGDGDDTITANEIDQDGKVTVTVELPDDAKAGNTLVVNGEETTLTDKHIEAGKVDVKVPVSKDGQGKEFTATATIKDGNNTSGPASDTATQADTTPPVKAPSAPTGVTIGDGDDTITANEIDQDGKVTVTVELPDDAKAGNTLVVNGEETTLTDKHIEAGKVDVKVPVSKDGQGKEFTATATIKDGNNTSGPASDTATQADTTPPVKAPSAPTGVTIGDGDDTITANEIDQDGKVTVTVELPDDAKAGNTLVVNGEETTLTDKHIEAGKVDVKVPVSKDGQGKEFTATATIKDGNNTSGPASDTATQADTTPPVKAPSAPTGVTIGDGDDTITANEIDQDGKVTVTVELPDDAKAGNTLVVNGEETTLTDKHIEAGKVDVKVPVSKDGQGKEFTATATIKDGNNTSGPASDTATQADTTPPVKAPSAPTGVTIGDGDDTITANEIDQDGKVTVTVELPDDAKAGNTLVVNGEETTLTDKHIEAGKVDVKVPVSKDGQGKEFTATATIKDGNNTSGPASDTATQADTTPPVKAPSAPTGVTIGDGDDTITANEIDQDGKVTVTVELPDDAKAGNTLVVNGEETTLTDKHIEAGKVDVKVPVSKDGQGKEFTATATIKDGNNTSGPASDTATQADTTPPVKAPSAPTGVTIGDGDDTITANEIDQDGKVTVTVELPDDAKAGNTLVVNGEETTLTDKHIEAGKVDVKVPVS
ncbi:beta strand repeat-containing protein, partial [Suttonella indologenes]|uniref:beta strand repeat-containing protein n=1 Tax=Suttonella indologenes TaxID=13276 RepID=UPI0011C06B14